ncbi:amidohydrolase [Spirosoma utsteinense]|uniref:Amidohydrolase n=1 Tax=Spirosoma utsteinense TaxID=2585773 RepID=A0ABR6WA28_9BACT|nr:amidohydrolase [Spirosoma utsteinense]MBC3788246.1 amidohydrolase [Spirosoma utsteinense]MBC3793367.1 amidohydrolase [Spirosoma utsteinense]
MTRYEPDRFIQFRRELHQFPDLSGQEVDTRHRIKAFVSQFAPSRMTDVAGTGLLLQYGQDAPGPVTLIRADIDALPIQEVNTFAHRSQYEGVSHKCGHDGHAAILARLASLLAENPIMKGRVYLVFQPAEETGQGAAAVLNDPAFAEIRPDRAFALHNLPGYEQGVIVCKPGPFTPSVLSMIVTFTGYVSHSAEPENGLNPAYAMADFMLKARQAQQPDPASDDFALITPVYTTMGERSYGISAGYGEVHLTLRTQNAGRMDALTTDLLAIVSKLSAESGLVVAVSYTDAFFANENDEKAVEQIRASARMRGYDFIEKQEPFKWGEDFGLFTQTYKGAMFGIGNGIDSPALHNNDYDFNDALIEPAARLFLDLIELEHQ